MTLIRGEIERTLEGRIQCFYSVQLERQPQHVACQIIENRVFILLEDALTYPEILLLQQGHKMLAGQVREHLHQILRPHIQALIESVTQVAVVDLSLVAQLDGGYVSLLAILAEPLCSHPKALEEAG